MLWKCALLSRAAGWRVGFRSAFGEQRSNIALACDTILPARADYSPPTHGVAPGYSHVGIVLYNVAGRRVILGHLPFLPRPFIPTLLHTHLASPSSALKTSMLRAAEISSLAYFLCRGRWERKFRSAHLACGRHLGRGCPGSLLAPEDAAQRDLGLINGQATAEAAAVLPSTGDGVGWGVPALGKFSTEGRRHEVLVSMCRKVTGTPYWLGCQPVSRLPAADWRTAFRPVCETPRTTLTVPIADLQRNKYRAPYCQVWSNTGYSSGQQPMNTQLRLEQQGSQVIWRPEDPHKPFKPWFTFAVVIPKISTEPVVTASPPAQHLGVQSMFALLT
ncbi:hypothetical protein PR048_022168 [Dryococelus australis]|uniref:Uncharacterized protein n=1 Tax=Dryococelus australis TaxID=614101 RepID=A0ABQ9H098_9NEOP|nr:hypothetical protein PR048_022168 [Dryococelus australis]